MTMIDLIVHMDCAGCESKIKKALQKLKGVDDVEVDINMQKVTVMGWADQDKILKAIRKTGRKADLWPYSPETQHNAAVINELYYNHHHHHHDQYYSTLLTGFDAPALSYNYLTATNYDNADTTLDYVDIARRTYDLQPYSALADDKAAVVFSDENPHACSIM